ncbi:hypothetical protein EVAR_70885_1 [Eumeta japonica]|uniref:Uncharacterized protein n=1 Tax=Eumeta variegata TaxID=151549 RepID=A0A4C2AC27_EUMVA|nr:hypothetical protein EVAR_70885_1 [Eumeta japonica]
MSLTKDSASSSDRTRSESSSMSADFRYAECFELKFMRTESYMRFVYCISRGKRACGSLVTAGHGHTQLWGLTSLSSGFRKHLSLDRPASRLRSRSPRLRTRPPVRAAAVERYQCSGALYRPLCASNSTSGAINDPTPAPSSCEVVRFGGAALGRGGA